MAGANRGKCSLRLYNGEKKSSDFSAPEIIVPRGISNLDVNGFFDCNNSDYSIMIPENFECEICTFEWVWQKDPTKKEYRRSCADIYSIHKLSRQNGANPQFLMFSDQQKAQTFLDKTYGIQDLQNNSFGWVLLISSIVLTLILLTVCFIFCSKKRNMYSDFDSEYNRNVALHLTQESRDFY